ALTIAENTSRNAVIASAATNSTTNRWGHTWTLSPGVALTSWMEPDLTTVSRRWVWPSGPVATGGGAVATAAAAGAAPPGRVRSCSGMRPPGSPGTLTPGSDGAGGTPAGGSP